MLSGHFQDQSRARLQKWIEQGAVEVDGQRAKPSLQLKVGQEIWVLPPEPEAQGDWLAETMPLDIVFEDADLLVVNKPAGLVVHPAAGHPSGTLLNGLLGHCAAQRDLPRAGIVHRLDRDTTGLMVVAKTLEAQTELVRQLQARTVSRQYWALAWGSLRKDKVLKGDIGRDPKDRQRMAVVVSGGKPATTHVFPVAQGSLQSRPVTLVRCQLETGRTHQIRVHLQQADHPLVGDPVYTRRAPIPGRLLAFERQALHAFRLGLVHPRTQAAMQFLAPWPADFLALLELAGIEAPKLREDRP